MLGISVGPIETVTDGVDEGLEVVKLVGSLDTVPVGAEGMLLG